MKREQPAPAPDRCTIASRWRACEALGWIDLGHRAGRLWFDTARANVWWFADWLRGGR